MDFTKQGEMTEEGYGSVESRLDNITDAVNALRHTLMGIAGNKPGRFEQVERPTNAIKKYMENARIRRHDALLDEVAQARDRRKARLNNTG